MAEIKHLDHHHSPNRLPEAGLAPDFHPNPFVFFSDILLTETFVLGEG